MCGVLRTIPGMCSVTAIDLLSYCGAQKVGSWAEPAWVIIGDPEQQ